jgi:arginine deiminase
MSLTVQSEVGQLRQVIVHRPGLGKGCWRTSYAA